MKTLHHHARRQLLPCSVQLCKKGNLALEGRVLVTLSFAESEITHGSQLKCVRRFQHKNLRVDSDFPFRGSTDFHRLVAVTMLFSRLPVRAKNKILALPFSSCFTPEHMPLLVARSL